MKNIFLLIFLIVAGHLFAQDTITLSECHRQALENAPRLNDRQSIRQIGELKSDQAGTNWYPSLNLNGKISYQSDVVTIALSDTPVPFEFPEVPHDQYGLNLDISQTLYDGGITKQKKNYERALTEADLQQLEVDLYGLKTKVNQYYFAILVLQESHRNLGIHMDNLNNRLQVLESAVENGTMLESGIKILQVEILRVKQSMLEVESRRISFLQSLNILCGTDIKNGSYLEKPMIETGMEEGIYRPEYLWFELKSAAMEAGKELIEKKRMPMLYAYGQTGYGKPGYNMMGGEWDFYYLVGAGIRWNIWDWNSTSREKQVIEHQQQMLLNRRASFDLEIESLKVREIAKMEQFKKSMELETEVLTLQKEISENAAIMLANGTITTTEYITELNKESISRINLATHQIQFLQSAVNYLTIQGNL